MIARKALLVAATLLAACGDASSPSQGDAGAETADAARDAASEITSDVEGIGDSRDAVDAGADATFDGSGATCPFETCPPPPVSCEGSECPVVVDTRQIVPGEGLPAEVVLQAANNNLDVIEFEGRVFLAFRTAPTHFASALTQLWVVSSDDEQTWTFEASFDEDTDLREPRFAVVGGSLFLYYAVLGDSPTDFEPQGMRVVERLAVADWSTPEWSYIDEFIPWRTGVDAAGVAWLVGYDGGANIYDFGGVPLRIHWLQTTNGREFEPYRGDDPVVLEGGGSETALVQLDDGTVIAVVRNEAGSERGFGSQICRGEADAPTEWRCVYDPRKFDSPLAFVVDDQIWLVARRQVSETGYYDLALDDLDLATQELRYQWEFWNTQKRCALWRVDTVTLEIEFALDLPSRGDTCFASVLTGEGNTRVVYNYSSPIDGADLAWNRAQTKPTYVYRHVIEFP
jgi:hypothetical protein